MDRLYRENVLVTACLKTPIDPRTKVPLALYEREKFVPYEMRHMAKRDDGKQVEYDSDSDEDEVDDDDEDVACQDGRRYSMYGDHADLQRLSFSNQEYYRKVEELKHAHLQTMTNLEAMCRRKLDISSITGATLRSRGPHVDHSLQWRKNHTSPVNLRKAASAVELNHAGNSSTSDTSEEDLGEPQMLNRVAPSPKGHIKGMWQGFAVEELTSSRYSSCPSLREQPSGTEHGAVQGKTKEDTGERSHSRWRHRITVPKPFQMTLREAEKKHNQVRSRSEVELENALLKKQLEELAECQKKFRASPAPAHLHLPLYKKISERDEERRRFFRDCRLATSQRERGAKEAQARDMEPKDGKRVFRARPIPRSVYDSTVSEQLKEEQLYRAIKMQMRSWELLHSASTPHSMLAQRFASRKKNVARKDGGAAGVRPSFRPKINGEVPDLDASYRRFRRRLQDTRDVRPVTVCEPFQLRTAQISSHRDRVLADVEADRTWSRATRCLYSAPARTKSSLGSSLSDNQEVLPTKITGATKMRQEAVRKVLEQKKKAEEQEEEWRAKQREKERRLQKVITSRALANDPHTALAQTCPVKLRHFRKQDLQRRKEYAQEMRDIEERVKERPLLLEQVTQRNAKRAVERRFAEALRGLGLSEHFISSKASKHPLAHKSQGGSPSGTPSDNSKVAEGSETLPADYPDDYEESDQGVGEREKDEGSCGRQTGTEKDDDDDDDDNNDGNNADQSELEGKEGNLYGADSDQNEQNSNNDTQQ